MDEAEALADRVAVLANRRIVAQGTPASLGQRESATAHIGFRLPSQVSITALPVSARALPGDRVRVETSDVVEVLHRLTGWALATGHPLPGLTVQRMTLEDVYLQLTRGPDAPVAG